MNKSLNIILSLLMFTALPFYFIAQNSTNKVWFDGLSRTYFARDAFDSSELQDTLSSRNSSSGYNLVDLNTHVNPTKDIEIFAQLRVRNEFGGFFGSGTSIDVRQLRASGVINNKVNFSIGDIFLKQNRFTLYNNEDDLSFSKIDIFRPYTDIVHYENFYTENRWRLQGLQTDFSFKFDRFIRTLEFDFFITRPRGSSQLSSSSYSPDLLLAGGSMFSKISNKLFFESNYINLYEVPSTGTINISLRNPVYHAALIYNYKINDFHLKHKIQSGFSQRNWLYTDLGENNHDSTVHYSEGMFFELENELLKKDSSFKMVFGVRYVDPNFRSAGAQTRRIDFNENSINTVYPNYTNAYITRPVSMFDIVSDENIYNQDLSGTLMDFNPIYSNVNPYGTATPNRMGFFLETKLNRDKAIEGNLNSSFLNEVIGQGTNKKRNFLMLSADFKLKINELLNKEKEVSLSFLYRNELTSRDGDSISAVKLDSRFFSSSLNFELSKKFYLQLGVTQIKAKGNEFLSLRNNYGNIQNFSFVSFNREDFLYITGISYKLKENIYANVQYNWWGSSFLNQSTTDFNYNRLLFIFSVKL